MRNCFICGNKEKTELFDSSVTIPSHYPLKGEQKIVQCRRCGFIFSDSENTQGDYQRYYETLNKHKKRAADAGPLDRAYYEKIFDLLGPLDKNWSILDFGSGDLLMKNILAERGFNNLTVFDVDMELEPASRFDLIVSLHTFEHVLDGQRILGGLVDHLKDDGQLLLATPDGEGYLENYCGPYNWFDLEHINHFSRTSMRNFVKNKGLSVVKCLRDRREVRPGLFYPEVIIHCIKNPSAKENPREEYDFDDTAKVIKAYIDKSAADFEQILKRLAREIKRKVVIRGIGIMAMRLIRHFNFGNAEVEFVDGNPLLHGREINGRKILSPEEMEEMDLDNDDIVIIAAVNYKDILKAVPAKFSDRIRLLAY